MIRRLKRRFRKPDLAARLPDVDPADLDIILRSAPFTMTNATRLCALVQAARHVVRAVIPGDIVECGVWKAGA